MKKILNWIFACMLAVSIGGLAFTSVSAEGETAAVLALLETDRVTATAESDAANAYTNEDRKGILIEGTESGSGFTFADTFSGTFETDFRIFTERTYEESEYAGSSFRPDYGVKTLTFTFTDKADAENTFDVVFQAESDFRALPQVYVEADGEKAGIYYRARMAWNGSLDQDYGDGLHYYGEYNKANSETKLANNNGKYTYVLDSTFGNLAWWKDELVDESQSVIFGFDAQDMRVYVRSRNEAELTVWDFSEMVNDGKNFGKTLGGFEEYTVSAEFTSVTDKGASMVLYELNGESLAGTSVGGSGAPSLKAEAPAYILCGQPTAVPKPYAFDLKDKAVDAASVSVRVLDPTGAAVSVTGLNGGKYAEGARFTADMEGDYTVEYTVTDKNSVSAKETVLIRAYREIPATSFDFQDELKDIIAGTGNTLRFEMPEVYNSLIPSVTVKAAISKGGETLQEFTEGETFSYTFEEAGEYTLTYTASTEETVSAEITVSDGEPVFSFIEEPAAAVIVGNTVELFSAEASLGGTSATCYSVVQFPDGTRYKNTYFVASQAGVYRVIYYAEIGGVLYQTERTFVAELDTASMFEVVSNADVTPGTTSHYADDMYGTLITTSGAGTVKYTHPINFTNKTKNDPFVEFVVTPETWGVLETKKVRFTLTDTENINNYITVEVRNNLDMDNMSDVKASANGQMLKGLRGDAVMTHDNWGTMIDHSFLKYVNTVKLCYDNATKAIYANGVLVIDLDNPLYFDNAFEGFSAGTATLTIETVETIESSASLMIVEIDGVAMDSAVLKDTVGPAIEVDLGEYKEMPLGAVGHPYAVFPATAYDVIDGDVDVKINVYRKVNGVNVSVSLKNGVFEPTEAGDYIVQYSSADASGNVSKVSYTVTVQEDAGRLELALGKESDETPVGLKYELPSVTASSVHGNVDVSAVLTFEDGTEIAVENGSFVPEKKGVYTWTVKASDYIGQELTEHFELTVGDNVKPVIEEVKLPSVAIAGESIVLPDFVAKDYSGDEVTDAEKTIKVSFKGQETVLDETRAYTPVMEETDDAYLPMTVTYAAETADGQSDSAEYTVVVVNVKGKTENGSNGYVLSRFFYGEDFEVVDTTSSSSKDLIYRTSKSGATLQYVRTMISADVSIDFYMSGGADSVTVRLTDSIDSSIAVEFRFTPNGDNSTLRIVGEETEYSVGGSLDEIGDRSLRIKYNDLTQYLVSSDTETGADMNIGYVRKSPDGSAFNGFPSGLVNIFVEVGNVKDSADVLISSMGNNQAFSNETITDSIRPMLGVMGEYASLINYGEDLTIFAARASDVLDSASVTLSVTAPDKTTILRNVSADEDRVIKADQYGYYQIVYTVKSSSGGRSTTMTYPVYCVSNEPIEVKVNGDVPSSAKLDSTFTIPEFYVEGGRFESSEVYTAVYLIDPDYTMSKVTGSVTFSKKGTYILRFYAQDPDYNTDYVDYRITVA